MADKISTSNHDGIVNVLTNLNVNNRDRITGALFVAGNRLDQNTLENIYRYQGFGKRIVDLITNEMTRQWFEVSGDIEGNVLATLEEISAKEKITDLLRWARLYGGAIAIIGADDGQELSQPLNEKNIRSVEFIHVFDKNQISWSTTDLYNDPVNPKYGTPSLYTMTPYYGGIPFVVHETRTLRLDGEKLPNRQMIQNNGWGDSVLQACYDELRGLLSAYKATSNIIEDFIQTILSVQNLGDMLAAGQDELIKKRLNIIDLSRSVANTILLDADESYQKQASSVSGLDQLIDRFSTALCAVTGIPYTFLMGKSPAGLSATGDSDIRMFYDMIKSAQEDRLKPILERLVKLVILSKNTRLPDLDLENWKITFNPLWQETIHEKATLRKVVAETDQIYINTGVLDPAEVAISRFGGHNYTIETEIDVETREPGNQEADREQEIQELKEFMRQSQAQAQQPQLPEPPQLPPPNNDSFNLEFISVLKTIAES